MPGAIVERSIERVPGRQHAEQVVEGRADVAHVDLDVREGRCAERDHDLTGRRRVGDAIAQLERPGGMNLVEQRLCTGLLEGHPALADGAETRGIVVDPDHPKAPSGEGECQGQPDAAQADDGDVGIALRRAHPAKRLAVGASAQRGWESAERALR